MGLSVGTDVVHGVSVVPPSSAASGWTLVSDKRPPLDVMETLEEEVVELSMDAFATHSIPHTSASTRLTVEHSMRLMMKARGGACIVIAPNAELRRLMKHATSCDEGGMTQCMKGLRVCDTEFERLFLEFTRHTDTDRWPDDHPEPVLRGKPKDGIAALLSTNGYRVKCAVKLEGLPLSSANWPGRGMRHTTALQAADFLSQAVVFTRSCNGEVHALVKEEEGELNAYGVINEPRGSAHRRLSRKITRRVTAIASNLSINLSKKAVTTRSSFGDDPSTPCSLCQRPPQTSPNPCFLVAQLFSWTPLHFRCMVSKEEATRISVDTPGIDTPVEATTVPFSTVEEPGILDIA
jgi:hypothetical protein